MTPRTPRDPGPARRPGRSPGRVWTPLPAGRIAEGLRRIADRLERAAAHPALHAERRHQAPDAGPPAAAGNPVAPPARPRAEAPARPPGHAPARNPRPATPDTHTAPTPAVPPATRDCVAVARDVLAVADRLRNEELARRLFDAVGRLPGLRTVRPSPGDPFEPAEHHWDETRSTDDPAREDTVAALLAPGFLGPQDELIRTARVAVYATGKSEDTP